MHLRFSIPAAAVTSAVALSLVGLSACSSSDTAAGSDDGGRVDVVASFYPMQYLVEEIGRDHVSVTTLTRPGVEPHDLELTPQQTAQLGESDFVLYLKGLQPAVDEAVAQSGVKDAVDATALTTLEDLGTADTEDGEEGGEAAASLDPHIWLDPVKYAEVAKGVGAALEKADPENAAAYRKNTEALVAKLDSLDARFADGLENSASKVFITSHTAFGYLAQRYGLEQQGIAGLDPESEPSAARMKELQEIAKRDKVTTVFFETLASDKTAKTLARDTGLKTDLLDPVEGITEQSRGDDYIEVMGANLAALQKALGAK
ncbi:zinc ABC transporter substrate-binding protein [Streptomyces prasinosporus]|uniref:Zinc ABC transporter substrate-binding protein n=2 Tax=Streptomyces TaxID=1883 RepID=A0ABP6U2N0_9ACTN|nr:metal ABC transporter substrate-binding protein [Streptomyces tricolor]MCG0062137.1 metal ABC transporter substrate-binding protein [Streptomyces tricolor]GHC14312.1 zinc ABC transporter substrate-binding protein [Streptomyces albogriseolus]